MGNLEEQQKDHELSWNVPHFMRNSQRTSAALEFSSVAQVKFLPVAREHAAGNISVASTGDVL